MVDQTLDGVITYPNQLQQLHSSEEVAVRTYGEVAVMQSRWRHRK